MSSFVQAEKTNSIHWLYSEVPPAHVVKGEYRGLGYADLTLQLLIDSLPEYEHLKLEANYKRSLSEMSKHHNRCHAALLKSPDREESVIFSEPVYLVSANRLFVQKEGVATISRYLNKRGKVDLARL